MFDIGATELLLIVIVAVVVIGPKDMPTAFRTAGRWIGKMRKLSSHFRTGLDSMVREAELEDMEKQWKAQNEKIMREHPQGASAEMEPTGAYPAKPANAEPAASRDDASTASAGSAAGQPKNDAESGTAAPPAAAKPDQPPQNKHVKKQAKKPTGEAAQKSGGTSRRKPNGKTPDGQTSDGTAFVADSAEPASPQTEQTELPLDASAKRD